MARRKRKPARDSCYIIHPDGSVEELGYIEYNEWGEEIARVQMMPKDKWQKIEEKICKNLSV